MYVPCLIYPWLRTCFEYGLGQKAQIFIEENGFIRITIPANFDWVPGQHCFLRFRSFGVHALTSHPFTICSLPSRSPQEQSQITFYVRHRGGLTARLYEHALRHPGKSVPVLVDGPYGGIDLDKYYDSDHLVVIAGGSGAGWTLAFVEQFVRCNLAHRAQQEITDKDDLRGSEPLVQRPCPVPRSLRVILATRDYSTRAWFHQTIDKVLSKYPSSGSSLDLQVQVHLTGPIETQAQQQTQSKAPQQFIDEEASASSASTKNSTRKELGVAEAHAESTVAVQEHSARPPLPSIVHDEAIKMAQLGHSLGVFVCGPLTMQNDVRNAVAAENLSILKSPRSGGVYLHLEHFSWA